MPRLSAGAAVLLLVAACSPDSATAPDAGADAVSAAGVTANAQSVTVAMSNLDNPRGLAWGPRGALYVAEAGNLTINGPCVAVFRGENCYSGTGGVSRLWRGRQERVISGLPSAANIAAGDAIGPNDVSFGGGLHVTVGWGGDPAARAGLGAFAKGFASIIRVNGRTWKVEADIGAFERAANPAGGPFDSNPYGGFIEGGGGFVPDAGGNSLLEFRRNGDVSLVAVFPPVAVPAGPFNPPFAFAEPVPTEVEYGPDGALYVSELTGIPTHPGIAGIYRVVPGQAPTLYAGGFTQVVDFDWADDGTLWVLQYAAGPFFSGPGSLIRVAPNGARTTVVSDLDHPTAVLAAPDGSVYVSNRGNLADVGEVLRVIP